MKLHRTLAFACIMLAYQTALSQSANFSWAYQWGSRYNDAASAILADPDGNVYSVGHYGETTDFDPGPGTHKRTIGPWANRCMFFSKLDKHGNFIWVKVLNDWLTCHANGLAFDPKGNIIMSGDYRGITDFDFDTSKYIMHSTIPSGSAFVAKYDTAAKLSWARSWGNKSGTGIRKVQTDIAGNVYALGSFKGTVDFDPDSTNTYYLTSNPKNYNAFIVKLDAYGNFKWAKIIKGDNTTLGSSMVTDKLSQVYITGHFYGVADFDPDSTSTSLDTALKSTHFFILKLDSNGKYIWHKTTRDSTGSCQASDIVMTRDGALAVAGQWNDTIDFDFGPGTKKLISAGKSDIFIAKYTPKGALSWVVDKGGTGEDGTYGVKLASDTAENLYVLGNFSDTVDFDPGQGKAELIAEGNNYDGFLLQLDKNGGFEWVMGFVGTGIVWPKDIYVDHKKSIYACGSFTKRIDFDPGHRKRELGDGYGKGNAFVARVSHCYPSSSTQKVTSCGRYTSPSGKFTWSRSGTYHDTILNETGCDSAITINLTVKWYSGSYLRPVVCNSYTSPSGKVFLESGIYRDTILNHVGCDSAITIALTVHDSAHHTMQAQTCGVYTSPSGKKWSKAGTYVDTIPTYHGCDSIITIHLTITNIIQGNISVKACESYTSPSGKRYTTTGTYIDTVPVSVGCDSIITIDLEVLSPKFATRQVDACGFYKSPSGLYTWNQSGTYKDTLQAHNSCDSIITIQLTLTPLDTVVTLQQDTLRAQQPSVLYRWLDCADNMRPIPNAFAREFVPSKNGIYAVELIKSNCVDTSRCVDVIVSSTSGSSLPPMFSIYPNPSSGLVNVSLAEPLKQAEIKVISALGQQVYTQHFKELQQTSFDLNKLPGMYFVMIRSEETVYVSSFQIR